MKKIILSGIALMFAFGAANAQGWTLNGAHDDFVSATPYDSVVWSADAAVGGSSMTISRPGNHTMVINANNIGVGTSMEWPTFRVSFSPDANNPSPLNLKANGSADIVFDVENNSTGILFAKIELEDANGVKAGIEPNISDVTQSLAWGDQVNGKYPRKAVNGFVLDPESRGTFTIDLSSVEEYLGGLTRTGWVGDNGCTTDGPYCGPVTEYQIDPTKIVAVIFTVNYKDGSYIISMGKEGGDHTDDYILDPLDATSYTGEIIFHDFRIGTVTTGVNETVINRSLSVYPTPADDNLNVSFESNTGAEVSLSDVVGNRIFSTTASKGENNISINTADLPTGMYILNIATETGRVARKILVR
ncbi:MAG TPA: T9SS type A sorting domain-containing protein [Cytophagaceae bacterium]